MVEEAKPKHHRYGYMGHLVNMCKGIMEMKDTCNPAKLYLPTEGEDGATTLDAWEAFCAASVKPAVEIQSKNLGGYKATEWFDMESGSELGEGDNYFESKQSFAEVAFAQYVNRRITTDFPDGFGGEAAADALKDNEDLVPEYGNQGVFSGENEYNTDAPAWMAEETEESWVIDDGMGPEAMDQSPDATDVQPEAEAGSDAQGEANDGEGQGQGQEMNLSLDDSAGSSNLLPVPSTSSVEDIMLSPKGAQAVAGIYPQDPFASSPVASPGGEDWANFDQSSGGDSASATSAPFAVKFPTEEIEEASAEIGSPDKDAKPAEEGSATAVVVAGAAQGESTSDPTATIEGDLESESTVDGQAEALAPSEELSPQSPDGQGASPVPSATAGEPLCPTNLLKKGAGKASTPGKAGGKVGLGVSCNRLLCTPCLFGFPTAGSSAKGSKPLYSFPGQRHLGCSPVCSPGKQAAFTAKRTQFQRRVSRLATGVVLPLRLSGVFPCPGICGLL